jgi:hypothetical protein
MAASPSPPLARGLLDGRAAAGRLSGCGLGPCRPATTPDLFITFAAADV